MNDELFFEFRNWVRHEISDMNLATIQEYIKSGELMVALTRRQFQHLLDDLKLMENYKQNTHSTSEEWQRIVDSYKRSRN